MEADDDDRSEGEDMDESEENEEDKNFIDDESVDQDSPSFYANVNNKERRRKRKRTSVFDNSSDSEADYDNNLNGSIPKKTSIQPTSQQLLSRMIQPASEISNTLLHFLNSDYVSGFLKGFNEPNLYIIFNDMKRKLNGVSIILNEVQSKYDPLLKKAVHENDFDMYLDLQHDIVNEKYYVFSSDSSILSESFKNILPFQQCDFFLTHIFKDIFLQYSEIVKNAVEYTKVLNKNEYEQFLTNYIEEKVQDEETKNVVDLVYTIENNDDVTFFLQRFLEVQITLRCLYEKDLSKFYVLVTDENADMTTYFKLHQAIPMYNKLLSLHYNEETLQDCYFKCHLYFNESFQGENITFYLPSVVLDNFLRESDILEGDDNDYENNAEEISLLNNLFHEYEESDL